MKKTLIFSALILLLSCLFVVSISAAGAESNEYGTLTTIEGASEPSVIDTTSRVVLKASDGTYYTVPSYYILEDTTEFTWKINSELNTLLGISETTANNMKNYVVRMEIPEGVVTINKANKGGAYAFEYSKSLIEFTWPSTLNYVGNYSFAKCPNLANIVNFDKYFKNVVHLGTEAFYQNTWGEGMVLEIPSTITTLPERCFQNTKISKAIIPSSVTAFKNHVFASCTNLTEIEFAKDCKLTEIGNYCFEYTSITSFDFTPFAKNMTSIGVGLFNGCEQLSTVTGYELVECAKEVGDNMFNKCPLTEIKFPPNITKIGQYAYYHSDDTGAIEVPDAVTYIGQYAFSWTNINSISLPANLVTLCNHAFANCKSLTAVDTSDSTKIEWIGKYCFEYANKLTSFDFTPFANSFKTFEAYNNESGAFNSCTGLTTVTGLENVVNVTTIPNKTFINCPLTEIKLPKNLITIGARAFQGHKSTQTEFRIPNSVTTIGDHAFMRGANGGAETVKVYLSANIETISNNYTFEDWNYTEMYIPAGANIPDGFSNKTLQAGVVYYYTGDIDTLTIGSTNNTAMLNAEWISVDDFTGASSEKNYIVYNYNLCDAFYYGEHNLAEGTGTNKFTGESYITSYVCEGPCSRSCGKNAVNELCGPLFENKGYSKIADGTSFTYGIVINEANIDAYKQITGEAFSYGFIVGAVPSTQTGNIIDANGNALIEKSICVDFATVEFYSFTIYNVKMVGIETATQKSQAIYCCAYIIDGSNVSYVGNSVTTNAATISSDAIEVIEAQATTPSKDEQNA